MLNVVIVEKGEQGSRLKVRFWDVEGEAEHPVLTDLAAASLRQKGVKVWVLPPNFEQQFKADENIARRLTRLGTVLPEANLWGPMDSRRLVYNLQKRCGIDFGVCEHYTFEDGRQFCSADGEKIECLCVIPEAFCQFRDKDGKPRHPDFLWQVSRLGKQKRLKRMN